LLFSVGCASVGEKSKVESVQLSELEKEIKSAGLSEKSIKVGKHTIYYHEGAKGETILLLHGFGGCKEHWVGFAKFFTSNYHVVAIDLSGHRKSSRIETKSYSIATQADRLDKIANALSLKKFHLAVNSMGGTIAGKYAAIFSDKLLSLNLIDTGGIHFNPETIYSIIPKSPEEFNNF